MLTGRNHGVLRLLPVIIVALAAIHLYRPPSRAAELEVSPDSVEYAVAARRLATTGRYEIRVNGRPLPPRYPPGFSAIFLAPVYALAPGNIGNGIFAVWAAACGAALLVYLIGSKLAGPWGGVFAAVIFLHHAEMMKYTQLVMTDIPAVLLGLTACLVYVRIRSRSTTAVYFGGGVICALSIAIRPLTGILAIPFVFEILRTRRHGWVRDLAAIALPCAAVVLLNGLYQQHAFGDWRRTGYQFWLPVPYDYFSLTFSPRYLGQNFARFNDYLVWAPLAMGTLGAIALCRRRSPHLLPVVAFTVLGALPLSVVHLFYFFTDIRFHFLGLTLVCLLAGCGAAVLIPEALRRQLWFMLPLACLTILVPRLPSFPLDDQPPMRFAVATTAARLLPGNAVLISGIDPPYLEELFVRGTARKVLPISRDTPYAAAVLARHRIAQLDPPPHNAADHACPGLVAGGAERLYPFTAEQGVTQLSQWIDAGVPVYAELLSTGPDQPGRRALSAAFRFTPASQDYPWLVRLEPIAPLPGK